MAREHSHVPVSPSAFGLYADVPEATLDPEWHALVRQHALRALQPAQRMLGLWSHRTVKRPRGAPHGLEACLPLADEVAAWGG
jgi:hypothetical protein